VDFTDAAGLGRWSQHVRFQEKVGFRESEGLSVEPVYTYDWWHGRTEPEIVSDGASSTAARPGGYAAPGWMLLFGRSFTCRTGLYGLR
jgi:hypothetical protein